MTTRAERIAAIEKDWAENPRWKGITRDYSAEDVERLRGSVQVEHTIARQGAEKLWTLENNEDFIIVFLFKTTVSSHRFQYITVINTYSKILKVQFPKHRRCGKNQLDLGKIGSLS